MNSYTSSSHSARNMSRDVSDHSVSIIVILKLFSISVDTVLISPLAHIAELCSNLFSTLLPHFTDIFYRLLYLKKLLWLIAKDDNETINTPQCATIYSNHFFWSESILQRQFTLHVKSGTDRIENGTDRINLVV